MNNYIVYLHKNKLNGCTYIGITSQKSDKRWRSGKGYSGSPLFYNAIQKYGWDSFDHKILFQNLNKKEAELIEVDLIYYFKKLNLSYNLADGGNVTTGLKMSDSARKNISDGHKGLKHSEYTKQKMSQSLRKRPKEIRDLAALKKMKPVCQYDLNNVFIKEWLGAMEIERELGFLHQNIAKCCKNKYKNAYGFIWKYKINNNNGL